MKIEKHTIHDSEVAEIISDKILISNLDDALDLLGNVYYQGFDKMIIHQKNLIPQFFDLKNKLAGEILQKFSTYRMRLFIVGDFSNISSKSLMDFVYESNQGKQVNFVASINEAIRILNNR